MIFALLLYLAKIYNGEDSLNLFMGKWSDGWKKIALVVFVARSWRL